MDPDSYRSQMLALRAERRRLEAMPGRTGKVSVVEELLPWLRHDAKSAELQLSLLRQLHWRKGIAEYEQWLGDMLPQCGLAQIIPGGLDSLPDIYAAMPWWLRQFESLRRPKNYRELLDHLYEYLEWYIDPLRPMPFPRTLFNLLLIPAFLPLLLVVVVFVFQVANGLAVPRWEQLSLSLFPLAVWTILIPFFLGKLRLHFIERQNHPLVNQLLLSTYLAEAYSAPRHEADQCRLQTTNP